MIEAVFFDLYETLISEWKNEKKKASYSTGKLGIKPEIFSKEWRIRKEQQMKGQFPNYGSALVDILNKLEITVQQEMIEYLEEERIEGKAKSFSEIKSEILSVLKNCRKMGLKVGLISNCTSEDVTAWESSPLPAYFDDVIFSFQVRLSKPDTAIYHLGCERLKVEPENCLFIGDGGSNELYGAAEAGLIAYHATWFQPKWKSKKITGYPKLEKTAEIIDVILNRNKVEQE